MGWNPRSKRTVTQTIQIVYCLFQKTLQHPIPTRETTPTTVSASFAWTKWRRLSHRHHCVYPPAPATAVVALVVAAVPVFSLPVSSVDALARSDSMRGKSSSRPSSKWCPFQSANYLLALASVPLGVTLSPSTFTLESSLSVRVACFTSFRICCIVFTLLRHCHRLCSVDCPFSDW